MQTHTTIDKAHGRVETRCIHTYALPQKWGDKPAALRFAYGQQVARLTREVYEVSRQTTRVETVYLITSLSPSQADAKRLLEINRGHWAIENKLHHVRDMAYDEDRCRSRTGNSAQTLACIRNFAISLMRLKGVTNIKAQHRKLASNPDWALKQLGI